MLRFRRFAITLFTVFVTFFCGCITGAETVTNEVSPETEALSSGSTRTLSDLMTVVTKENCSDYDFTEKAMKYLTIIGEQYPNRSLSEDGTDNVHDEFGNWLLKELKIEKEPDRDLAQVCFKKIVASTHVMLYNNGKSYGRRLYP